jgi:glyoxylase-like metal-dependent hydrolase (beta-lactamase superfamily II)
MADQTSHFESKYFCLQTLAEGVYAGMANHEEGTIANVGVVDLGASALVVDSFMLPQAARDLRAAVADLLGKPVSVLVNTHSHDDHFVGNYLFPAETRVISTHRNRELMAEHAREIPEEKEGLADYVADLRQQRDQAPDDATRQRLSQAIVRFSRFLEVFDEIVERLRLPDLTFDERLVIYGSDRRVELLSYDDAHTPSDVVVYLPDDRILFSADLVLVKVHPFMLHSNPDNWRAVLTKVEALDFETLVPGHGPLGTKADVAPIGKYLDAVERLVEQVIAAGGTVGDAVNAPLPSGFEGWSGGAYAHNMRFLFERLSESK